MYTNYYGFSGGIKYRKNFKSRRKLVWMAINYYKFDTTHIYIYCTLSWDLECLEAKMGVKLVGLYCYFKCYKLSFFNHYKSSALYSTSLKWPKKFCYPYKPHIYGLSWHWVWDIIWEQPPSLANSYWLLTSLQRVKLYYRCNLEVRWF